MDLFLAVMMFAAQEHPIPMDHVGDGPLHFRTLSPFQAIRPGFKAVTPTRLAKGEFEFGHAASWVNVWAFNEDDWLLDYEVLENSVWLSYGATERLAITLELAHGTRFGGRLDHLIEEFHDIVGAEDAHRPDFDENDFQVHIEPDGTRPAITLSRRDRGTFSTSATLTLQYQLARGDRVAPSVTVAGSLRAASEQLTHGQGLDAAVSLSLARRFGPVHLYFSANLAWYGRERFEEVELRPLQWFFLGAVEWRITPGLSLLFQYLLTEGAISGYRAFSEPSHELTFGWKVHLVERAVLEIGIIENIVTPDNSSDFGLHTGITYRW